MQSNYENLKQDLQISLELRETCQNGLYASLLDARKLLLQLGEDEAEASTTEAVHDKLNSLEASIKSMLGDNMINKIINEYESDIVDFERACGTGGGLKKLFHNGQLSHESTASFPTICRSCSWTWS